MDEPGNADAGSDGPPRVSRTTRAASMLAGLGAGVARVAERLGLDPTKPITLIPVVALGEPDLLVEVDAVAVLP